MHLSLNSNISSKQCLLPLKDEGIDRKVQKSGQDFQKSRDKLKTSIVHNTSEEKQYFTKIHIALAFNLGIKASTTDATQV